MLELAKVTVEVGGFRLQADFVIREGARVAVLGPSGSGKSTLLSVIAGFVRPASGAIRWQGRDLSDIPPGERPVTTVFQDQNLFPHLTVGENVGLGLSPALRLSQGDHDRLRAALARVGLEGMADRRPATLSGGQQGRVALARALIMERPVLLLDEAFGALGPAMKADMLDLLEGLLDETGATLLMVTHEPEDAERLCPETIVVADGEAAAPAPTAQLLANPPPALASYLGK